MHGSVEESSSDLQLDSFPEWSCPFVVLHNNRFLCSSNFRRLACRMQDAQQLVQEGIEATTVERDFKATVYSAMHKAHIGHEKVTSVSMQLRNMLKVSSSELDRQQRLQKSGQPEHQDPGTRDVDMHIDGAAVGLVVGLQQQEQLGSLQGQIIPADDPGMEWEDL